MAQKINPISLRLGKTNRNFDCCWYNNSNYVYLLMRHFKIKNYINTILKKIDFCSARLLTTNLHNKIKINVFFCNPAKARHVLSQTFRIVSHKKIKNSKKNLLMANTSTISDKQNLVYNYVTNDLLNTSTNDTTGKKHTSFDLQTQVKHVKKLDDEMYTSPSSNYTVSTHYAKHSLTIEKINQLWIKYFISIFFSRKIFSIYNLQNSNLYIENPTFIFNKKNAYISLLYFVFQILQLKTIVLSKKNKKTHIRKPDTLYFPKNYVKNRNAISLTQQIICHTSTSDAIFNNININDKVCHVTNKIYNLASEKNTVNKLTVSMKISKKLKDLFIIDKSENKKKYNFPNIFFPKLILNNARTVQILNTQAIQKKNNVIGKLSCMLSFQSGKNIASLLCYQADYLYSSLNLRTKKALYTKMYNNSNFNVLKALEKTTHKHSDPIIKCQSSKLTNTCFKKNIFSPNESVKNTVVPIKKSIYIQQKHVYYTILSLINKQHLNKTYNNFCKLTKNYTEKICFPIVSKQTMLVSQLTRPGFSSENLLFRPSKKSRVIFPALVTETENFIAQLFDRQKPIKLIVANSTYKHHLESMVSRNLSCYASLQFFKTQNIFQSATYLIDEIVYYIEKKVSFFKLKNSILRQLTQQKFLRIKGMRVMCSGRVGGKSKKAQKAKIQSFKYGETSLHMFSSKIDFKAKNAFTNFGTLGIKVWICYM